MRGMYAGQFIWDPRTQFKYTSKKASGCSARDGMDVSCMFITVI